MIAIKSLATVLGTLAVLAVVGVNVNHAKAQSANKEEALKILDAYTKSQDKFLRSFIVKFEEQLNTDCRLAPPYDRMSGKFTTYGSFEVRSDGRRFSYRELKWGSVFGSLIPKEDSNYNSSLFDGSRNVYYNCRLNAYPSNPRPMGSGTVETKIDRIDEYNISNHTDSQLLGALYNDRIRVDVILRDAEELTLSREQNSAGSPGNYIIRAKTKWGRYTVWLDPTHDYQIARAETHKEGGDFVISGKPLPQGYTMDYTLNDILFQKIGEQWIPMEATWTYNMTQPGGYYTKMRDQLKRTKVILSPDFDALHAFEPDDVRDGAIFLKGPAISGPVGVQYIWRKGELIPATPSDLKRPMRPAAEQQLSAQKTSSRRKPTRHPKPGMPAPDFIAKTIDGKAFKLSDQHGKVVILHFWSALEPRCVQLNPALQSFYTDLVKRYGTRVVMLGLSLEDDEALIRNFVVKDKLTWPQTCLGENSKVAEAYGVKSLPDDFMIGPDGKVLINRESPERESDTAPMISKALGIASKK